MVARAKILLSDMNTFVRSKNKKVTVFNKKNYKVIMSVGKAETEMHLVICILETGAGPNLFREAFIGNRWHKMIRSTPEPDLKSTISESVCILGTINLYVSQSDCRVLVSSSIV